MIFLLADIQNVVLSRRLWKFIVVCAGEEREREEIFPDYNLRS